MSKQRDEFFDRKTSLADDRAERAAVEFLVIGNGSLRGRGFTNDKTIWLPRCR